MKKWLIASMVCMFPMVMFGLVIPMATLFNGKPHDFNETAILVFVVLYSCCMSIVFSTIANLVKYSKDIDSLLKARIDTENERVKLNQTIMHYNNLIKIVKNEHIIVS
ncbi:MAG: hypothetical protein HGB12_14090 [Bacteroidetes bacterium]|nr:hypothetical protein [Bacteroidota bacterium]